MNVDVHNLCLYLHHLGGIYVVEVLLDSNIFPKKNKRRRNG
jgi:hypothetical protein